MRGGWSGGSLLVISGMPQWKLTIATQNYGLAALRRISVPHLEFVDRQGDQAGILLIVALAHGAIPGIDVDWDPVANPPIRHHSTSPTAPSASS
jgi:hypothetical protein